MTIPSKTNRVYMLRDHKRGENLLKSGHIYSAEPHEQQKMIAEGVAAKVDFPTLASQEQMITTAVERHKKYVKDINDSPRYRDNRAEAEYLIEQAEQELAQKVEKHAKEYDLELRTLEAEIARSFTDYQRGTAEERERAREMVDVTLAQISSANNVVDVLDTLAARVSVLTEPEKIALLSRFDEIKARAEDRQGPSTKGHISATLKRINDGVNDIDAFKTADLRRKQLDAIRKHHNPDHAYRTYKLLNERRKQKRAEEEKPRAMSPESYAQYRSGA